MNNKPPVQTLPLPSQGQDSTNATEVPEPRSGKVERGAGAESIATRLEGTRDPELPLRFIRRAKVRAMFDNINDITLDRWIAAGFPEPYIIQRLHFFDVDEIEEYLQANRVKVEEHLRSVWPKRKKGIMR